MKSIKKLAALLLTVALVFATASGNFTMPNTARADDNSSTPTNTVQLSSASTATVSRKGKIGTEIDVPAGSTVLDPKGNDVDVINNKFTPTQVGYYSVAVTDGANTYDGFRILIEAEDAVVHIPFDGATIPTYTASGETVYLPKAEIAVLDSNGIKDDEKSSVASAFYTTIIVRVSEADGQPQKLSELVAEDANSTDPYKNGTLKKYKFDTKSESSGSYLVRYTAIAGTEANPVAVLTKDFTVKTQKDFNPTGKPQLNIANVPLDANLNTKITLPKASATDSWDQNVKIEITVTDPSNNPVKVADDSDPENIYVPEEAKNVEFDNNGNRSFYPNKTGTYVVKYVAENDKGEKAESRTSVSVQDRAGPTIVVDEENKIPSVWGKTVYWKGADGQSADGVLLSGAKIYIPLARAYDNDPAWTDKQVNISIKDPKGNIFFDTDSNSSKNDVSKIDSITEGKQGDTLTNYWFDVTSYVIADGSDTAGTYVIYYKARDLRSQETTRSYSVEIRNEFKDLVAPEISVKNIDDLIWVDEQFKKPSIEVTDEDNSRTDLTEVFEFKKEGTDTWISFEELNSDFVKPATAPAKNKTLKFLLDRDGFVDAKIAGEIRITLNAEDQVGNKTLEDIVEIVQVVSDDAADIANAPAISGTLTVRKPIYSETSDVDPALTLKGYEDYKVGDKVKLIDEQAPTIIEIEAKNVGLDKYIGYEVVVLDKHKKSVPAKTTSTYFEGKDDSGGPAEKAKLTIHQIEFEPKIGGTYTITIRATDLFGASSFITSEMNVEENTTVIPPPGGVSNKAINTSIPKTMEVQTRYSLPKWESQGTIGGVDYELVTIIHGGRYELRGNLFTPYEVGDIYMEVYNREIGNPENFGSSEIETIKVTDSARPEFRMLSDFEIYKAKFNLETFNKAIEDAGSNQAQLEKAVKDNMIKIPEISVINLSGTVTVDVEVTGKNGVKVELETEFDNHAKDAKFKVDGGARFFRPTLDGVYTITYTAKNTSGNVSTHTLTIPVGDLIAPTISNVVSETRTELQGTVFTFANITVSDTNGSTSYNITVKKQLIGPGGTVLISDSGATNSNPKTHTLDTPGTYKVRYEATDEAGNTAIVEQTINVTSKSSTKLSTQVIATIIFIAAALLFLAVLIYIMGFRKVSADKLKTKAKAKTETKAESATD